MIWIITSCCQLWPQRKFPVANLGFHCALHDNLGLTVNTDEKGYVPPLG